MDDKKKFEPLFPSEYEQLNKAYEHVKERLSAIDKELDNPLKDKGYNYTLTPQGDIPVNPSLRYDRTQSLEQERHKIITDMRAYFDYNLSGLDDKSKKNILDRYDYETSKNAFKDLSDVEFKNARTQEKSGGELFDFVSADFFKQYEAAVQSDIKTPIAGEKENIDVWAEKFNEHINRAKIQHEAGRTVETDKDKDIDLEKD